METKSNNTLKQTTQWLKQHTQSALASISDPDQPAVLSEIACRSSSDSTVSTPLVTPRKSVEKMRLGVYGRVGECGE